MTTPTALEDGTVTVVTGAGGGIGGAVADLLTRRGHRLALLDTDGEAAEARAASVRDAGGEARAYRVDVADADDVEIVMASVERDVGPIARLANVAGVMGGGEVLDELTAEGWQRAFDVNATGVFHVSRAAARRMAQRGDGAVVTVASNAAGVPRAGMAAYAASKAAARSFTLSLGVELGPRGVRCNVVAPGSTETPMLHGLWPDDTRRETTVRGDPEHFKVGIPLGHTAVPEDVAPGVAFLLSEQARHVTLATLLIDGGAALGAI